ncbi:MAG: hypothetical protein HYZ28_22930 [Myxococcales bacterium]|nr:hypothetical protein [Myxococcales bacterium]
MLPLPLTTVGASYGISERADLNAHLHGTTLAFGVAGLDAGGTYLAARQDGWVPALAVHGRLYGFTDLKAFRPYLELGGAASYLWRERFTSYLSANALGQAGAPPLLSFAAGEEVRLGRAALQLELRWFQPGIDTQRMAVDWLPLGRLGTWGVVLGTRVQLGSDGSAGGSP